MLHFIVALQIAATASGPNPVDSAATVALLRQEAGAFLWTWRNQWQASEKLRHDIQGDFYPGNTFAARQRQLANRTVRERVNYIHCHPDSRAGFPLLPTTIREGKGSLRAICPRWTMPDAPAHDERLALDDAIAESLRPTVRLARSQLMAHLEAASNDLPGDVWLAGQRVRFAVDQRDSAAAVRAARECRANTSWCSALEGYAKYSFGDVAGADSAFTSALTEMSSDERCKWNDVSFLLDEKAKKQYAGLSCAARDSVAARFWWVSDPLYSEPGNERRAEHFSRLVMIALRRDVSPGERWNWVDGQGGRSLREMLVRYGWPSQSWWSGPLEDASHYSYLMVFDQRERDAGLFTTQEYSFPRFRTVPDWSAIADPYHAASDAWMIAAPREKNGKPDTDWWPQEHFARNGGELLPIPDQQTAVFRRADNLMLAVATDITHVGLERGVAKTANASLVVSPGPDSVNITRKTVPLDVVTTWRTTIPARPAIIAVEARTTWPYSPTARTRFGIVTPAPLSVMAPGEIAISEPALVRPPHGSDRPASDPDVALEEMLGTTRLRDMSRVGIYWETYGIAANDSVDVSVRIDRLGQPSVFRRLGTALHMAERVDGSATVRWKEPQSVIATTNIPGPVPIQARNVTIDLSRLVPDRYSITVMVSRANGQTATASREFEIVR
jgi:hypothetical protein